MRRLLAAFSILLCAAFPARAQVGFEVRLPGVNIGINVPTYPRLVVIPGYPVYYAPQAASNYFFYDGLYWVYQSDEWYASSWYNGPWELVQPEDVPLYLLRVPVRYYRHPPSYFRGWRADAPPRWDEHWGSDWGKRRNGWNQWDRRSVPAAAPLPTYQRQYSGDRYPHAAEQQVAIRSRNYRYQPREDVSERHFEHRVAPPTQPRDQQRSQAPQPRSPPAQAPQRPRPVQPTRDQTVQRPQSKPPVQQPQSKPPQAQVQRAETATQGKGSENRAAAQGKGRDNENAPHGKGQESKKEEHDSGRQ